MTTGKVFTAARVVSHILQAAIILFALNTHAQTLPSNDEFDQALKVCVSEQHINLDPKFIDGVTKLYSGGNTRQALRYSQAFVSLAPDSDRLEAYRLYVDCVTRILPSMASVGLPPQSKTYRICTGEYERACQPHDVYLYCSADIAAWAKARCTSFNSVRLNTYGGNKCGYSLDEITCDGPR